MSRVILYIILGLLVLLIGCVGYLDYMSSSKPPTVAELLAAEKKAPQRPLVPVVVAAKPIAAGSLIAADALTIEQWPVRPADSRDNFEGLLGRRVRQDIAAGQPITSAQLTQGLSTYLKPGTRAVTLTLSMIANGSSPTVQPGDMVDLYVMQPGVDGGPVTATLLQSRVQVLAYAGQSLDGPDAGLAQSAVVAMPADKVDALLQAEGPGRIAVAVSRAEDDTPAPAATPAPPAPPAPPQPQAAAAQPKPAAVSTPVAAQAQPAGTQAQSVAEKAQAVANQAQVVAKQAQTVARQAQSVVESHLPPHAAAKPAAAKRAAHESRRERERARTRERSRAPAKPKQATAKPKSAPTPTMTPPVAVTQPAVSANRSAAQGVEGVPLLRAPLTQSFNAPATR